MQSGRTNVTFLLPDGLEPRQYQDLARALVEHVVRHSPATEAAAGAGDGYVTLSELSQAPPENVAVLNDSTWTLSLSVPEGTDLKTLAAAAKRLPGGGIEIEAAPQYRTSNPDG